MAAQTASAAVGLVFLSTALSKAMNPDETVRALVWVFPATPIVAEYALRALVLTEVVLGAALIFGLARRAAASCAAVLLIGFSLWLSYLILTDAKIGCGCGVAVGSSWLDDEQVRWAGLGRNIVLIGLLIGALRFTGDRAETGALSVRLRPSRYSMKKEAVR